MTNLLFILATYLIIGAAIWALVLLTLGEIDDRRRRDIAQLRREIDELRTRILTNHRP